MTCANTGFLGNPRVGGPVVGVAIGTGGMVVGTWGVVLVGTPTGGTTGVVGKGAIFGELDCVPMAIAILDIVLGDSLVPPVEGVGVAMGVVDFKDCRRMLFCISVFKFSLIWFN